MTDPCMPRDTLEHRNLPLEVRRLVERGAKGPKRPRTWKEQKPAWAALCKVATSALVRGWSYAHFEQLLMDPRSVLGRQVSFVKGGTISDDAFAARLRKAWDRQEAYLRGVPSADYAARRAEPVRDLIREFERLGMPVGMQASDVKVFVFVLHEAEQRGCLRMALPWRLVADGTGLGQTATRNALIRLAAAGVITRVDRGRASKNPSLRLAGVYQLATAAKWVALHDGSAGPKTPVSSAKAVRRHEALVATLAKLSATQWAATVRDVDEVFGARPRSGLRGRAIT